MQAMLLSCASLQGPDCRRQVATACAQPAQLGSAAVNMGWAQRHPVFISSCVPYTTLQALLKRLEDAAMAQRLGLATATSTAGSDTHTGLAGLSHWQAEIDQMAHSAAVVNEQEQRLDMRCTHFGDLEEAQRVLQEMQQHAAQPAGEVEVCHV